MTVRALLLGAALAAAPLLAAAGQGQAASAPAAPARVPAVPQATAATLAPAAPPAAARAPTVKVVPVPAAAGGARPVVTRHAPPGPPPKEAWSGDGRTSSGVAPGVLARAATRTQQARERKVPAECALPPARRDRRVECPPATGRIESLEIDWNAPVAR